MCTQVDLLYGVVMTSTQHSISRERIESLFGKGVDVVWNDGGSLRRDEVLDCYRNDDNELVVEFVYGGDIRLDYIDSIEPVPAAW